MKNAHEDRRVGAFTLRQDLIEKDYETILEIFKTIKFVWRTEHDYQSMGITYWANCDQFDENEEACTVPKYEAIIHTENEYSHSLNKDMPTKIRVEWRKIK